MTCLNPVFTIGNQIGEVLEIHEGIKGEKNRKKCIELLDMVSVPRADKTVDAYPHELSGGMRQRVMIAMALSCRPELIIANAGVHFGINEDLDDNGITENPVLRFRILNTDGSVLPLVKGGDAFFDYGEMIEKFKNNFEGYMFSIPVNKEDGTITLQGGSYRLYLPTYDNKWYVLRFTTKQVGATGEFRSELTSVNGKPYTYTRWKKAAYTPISGYVTLGTSLNDAVKILGTPGSTYIDPDGYYAVYYYPNKPMLSYSSYIEMYKTNGQFVVTGWNNSIGMKVSGAAPLSFNSTITDVIRAMGTPTTFNEEPKNLLKQELREPALYNSMIEAIANGASKLNEIATKVGESNDKCAKYIKTLLELRILKKETPANEDGVSRKSIYRIQDNLFKFWYGFVFNNSSLVEQEMIDYVYINKIKPELNNYLGSVFEDICIEYLKLKNKSMELSFVFEKIGR